MTKLTFTIDLEQFTDPVVYGTRFEVLVDEVGGARKQWAIKQIIADQLLASRDAEAITKDILRNMGAKIGMHLLEEVVARTPVDTGRYKQSAPFHRYRVEEFYGTLPRITDPIVRAFDRVPEEREEADDMLDFFMNRGKYER